MKTFYSSLFIFLTAWPAISGQSLPTTLPHEAVTAKKIEFNDPLLNSIRQNTDVPQPGYTSRKKVTNQFNADVYMLDSIVGKDVNGTNQHKSIFSYDSNGIQTLDARYMWNDTNNIWIGEKKK